DDPRRRFLVYRGFVNPLRAALDLFEQGDIDLVRENIHWYRHQHWAGPAAFGQAKRFVDDLREKAAPLDAPGALHERSIDLELRRIGVQVDFPMWVFAIIVARHISRDDHEWNRIWCGIGVARRRGVASRPA